MGVAAYISLEGEQLYASAWGPKRIVAAAPRQSLTGTSANETLVDVKGGSRMVGGGGDDFYFVSDAHSTVVESATGGVDTVTAYVNYRLPANVENLVVGANLITGYGNALGNIVITKGLNTTLVGGPGGDILIDQGAGVTRFIFNAGDGQDRVIGFKTDGAARDVVRINGAGLTSFALVRSRLAQVGPDVVLTLSGADKVVFNDKRITDFTADNFQLNLDTSQLKLTFNDEFDALSLYSRDNGSGTWKTNFISGSQDDVWTGFSSRTLAPNKEEQLYVDPLLTGRGKTPLGVNPFSIDNGVLTINAERTPAALKAALWGYNYTSGLLTTETSFAQKYGYFEIRAQLPRQKGLWPAFWLMSTDGSWPPEIDIMEEVGGETTYQTLHGGKASAPITTGFATVVDGLDERFHTYGLLWSAKTIAWYIDGVEVAETATPEGFDKPMYILTNLAVGGVWPGSPPATFSVARMKVDYVRAYSLESRAAQ